MKMQTFAAAYIIIACMYSPSRTHLIQGMGGDCKRLPSLKPAASQPSLHHPRLFSVCLFFPLASASTLRSDGWLSAVVGLRPPVPTD